LRFRRRVIEPLRWLLVRHEYVFLIHC
jgi:hypothetical protein